MFKKYKKIILIISLVIVALLITRTLLTYFFSLYLKNNNLINIINLVSILTIFFPFLWLSYIRNLKLKISLMVIYAIPLLYFLSFAWLAILFQVADAVTMNNNGFIRTYEMKLDEKYLLGAYRTPDLGAFGGNYLRYYLVRDIFPGFEIREPINPNDINFYGTKIRSYVFNGNEIFFPNQDYFDNSIDSLSEEKALSLTKTLEKVNSIKAEEKNYQVKTLNNEDIPGIKTDGGEEIVGYSKDGQYYKVAQKIGLSVVVKSYDYYFWDNEVIMVTEKEEYYPYDENSGSMDYTRLEEGFEGQYYFDNEELIMKEIKGQRRFGEADDIDGLIRIAKESIETLSNY